jgi:heme exporter protein C
VTAWLRRFEWLLTFVVLAAMVAAIYGALLGAPKERAMGNVQRIFYFHVPSAMMAFLGFAVVCLGGVQYLRTRDPRWDALGHAAAELGVLFCTIVLVTGPIWARPIWGTWWTWETRLTLTLLLWLIYVAYLLLRAYVDEPELRARFASILGILGFLVVPFVYFSVYLWGGLHPKGVITRREGLHPEMRFWFLFNVVTFLLLFLVLLGLRLRLGWAQQELEEIRQMERDR